MINVNSFSGKMFKHEDYQTFIDRCDSLGFNKKTLKKSAGGLDIFSFSLGDLRKKPVIHVDADIHNGHEWRSAYWLLHFMECLYDPDKHYPTEAHTIKKLKLKYSFNFIPVASPDNFITEQQGGNANGVNIADNFDYNWNDTPFGDENHNKGSSAFSENESQNIRDEVWDLKPVGYINCHGWGGFKGVSTRQPANKSYSLLVKDFLRNTQLSSYPIPDNDSQVGIERKKSSAYNWAGQQKSFNGQKVISTLFESGTFADPKKQSEMGVTGLLIYLIYLDNYLTYNSLTLN